VLPSKVVTEGPISVRFTDPGVTLPLETIRNGLPANDVSIELPLPQWVRLGGRYVSRAASGAENFDIELDVVYERWSAAERFTVRTNDLVARANSNIVPLGTITVEKQWQDVIAVNVGADYAVLDNLAVRAGGYYETAVSKPEFTNVDFATGQQIGLTAGATLTLGGFAASLGYEMRFQPDVTTTTATGQVTEVVPGAPAARVVVNGGTYRANSHSAVLGLGYRF
jgi:long-subunit fatty acid transport protein